MSKLIIICGLARSGKSTLANKWVHYEITIRNNSFQYNPEPYYIDSPRVVLCCDDLRLAMGARWNGWIENYIHAIQETQIRAFLRRGYSVLVDETHTTLSSIKKMLILDPNADFLIVDTSKEICIQRAIDSKMPDLIPVIERMDEQLLSWKNSAKFLIDEIREEVRKIQPPRIAL